MIAVRHLTKYFFHNAALYQISLDINPGTSLGLLGPNGAGKTTLFKLIAGLIHPDEGYIQPLNNNWPRIGYKPERLIYPPNLTITKYLYMMAKLANIPWSRRRQEVQKVLDQVQLTPHAKKRIGTCSKGMRQRLGLAQALLGDPQLLLIDEPSNGLDPSGQQLIKDILIQLRQDGKTIILSSHQLEEVTAVCSHLTIINQGQIRYHSTMNQALNIKPHTTITVNHPLGSMANLLTNLHPHIHTNGPHIRLEHDAISLRPHVISMLINASFDIIDLSQHTITLQELYSEVIV
ncbi:MAG TPA: ABC transporter ATP-binding protein [Anaerolineae bacterium]|nr:ABC transporter ATP-binding protein [Anaerolineae bacterium]